MLRTLTLRLRQTPWGEAGCSDELNAAARANAALAAAARRREATRAVSAEEAKARGSRGVSGGGAAAETSWRRGRPLPSQTWSFETSAPRAP
jgi:hypothetical protein